MSVLDETLTRDEAAQLRAEMEEMERRVDAKLEFLEAKIGMLRRELRDAGH